MSTHSTYDMLRHIADSWGLLAMLVTFLILVLWPFRPGARSAHEAAKTMIFKDDDDGR
ncbi:MAG: cbb3-type cytochrome c oxidase subunit 3 [Novosphingobium sp.]